MEINTREFAASNTTWLTQLEDIIELVGTDENQVKSSVAQQIEGFRFIYFLYAMSRYTHFIYGILINEIDIV